AVKALAKLAHKPVTEHIIKAYNQEFSFGPDYIIPKPFDLRLLPSVAPAVAKAAMESGVAQRPIEDFKSYISDLKKTAKRLAKGKF
ncbi:MAG: hypothetical protein KJ598_00085, partial [Nanoarchaeota archaeon]|nr:hypothetical protein [Nanoarchaeota archaeon]MBU1643537.1 hypothetical protein [Nanoarchaeota archaeon]